MRRLELDFQRSRRPLAVYALVVFAMAFAADAAMHHANLEQEARARETGMARRLARTAEPAAVELPAASAEDYTYARETIRRLTTPWNVLFHALEQAHTDRVALLAIEPDAENRTVSISGEARDYLSAVTYVARLSGQDSLRRVHLVRHEKQRGSPQRPIAFTASASWKERP